MSNTILQQDDCAPDSFEYFNKRFIELMGVSVQDFKAKGIREDFDEGRGIRWKYGRYELVYHCEDPYYYLAATLDGVVKGIKFGKVVYNESQ